MSFTPGRDKNLEFVKVDISVPEEELDGVDTVGQALTLVLGKLGANA